MRISVAFVAGARRRRSSCVRGAARAGLHAAERRTARPPRSRRGAALLDAIGRGAPHRAGAASAFVDEERGGDRRLPRAVAYRHGPSPDRSRSRPRRARARRSVVGARSPASSSLIVPFVWRPVGRRARAEAETSLARLRSLGTRALELLEGAVELRALGALERGARRARRGDRPRRRLDAASLRIGLRSATALDVLAGLAVGLVAMTDGFASSTARSPRPRARRGPAHRRGLRTASAAGPPSTRVPTAGPRSRCSTAAKRGTPRAGGPPHAAAGRRDAPAPRRARAATRAGAGPAPAVVTTSPRRARRRLARRPRPDRLGQVHGARGIAGRPLVTSGRSASATPPPALSARQRSAFVLRRPAAPRRRRVAPREPRARGARRPTTRRSTTRRALRTRRAARSCARGLDEQVGEEGRLLSAGERTRVALARAVLRDPGVLLLDEVGAHLDDAALAALRRVARRVPLLAHRRRGGPRPPLLDGTRHASARVGSRWRRERVADRAARRRPARGAPARRRRRPRGRRRRAAQLAGVALVGGATGLLTWSAPRPGPRGDRGTAGRRRAGGVPPRAAATRRARRRRTTSVSTGSPAGGRGCSTRLPRGRRRASPLRGPATCSRAASRTPTGSRTSGSASLVPPRRPSLALVAAVVVLAIARPARGPGAPVATVARGRVATWLGARRVVAARAPRGRRCAASSRRAPSSSRTAPTPLRLLGADAAHRGATDRLVERADRLAARRDGIVSQLGAPRRGGRRGRARRRRGGSRRPDHESRRSPPVSRSRCSRAASCSRAARVASTRSARSPGRARASTTSPSSPGRHARRAAGPLALARVDVAAADDGPVLLEGVDSRGRARRRRSRYRPDGPGKSSLLAVAARLEPPRRGTSRSVAPSRQLDEPSLRRRGRRGSRRSRRCSRAGPRRARRRPGARATTAHRALDASGSTTRSRRAVASTPCWARGRRPVRRRAARLALARLLAGGPRRPRPRRADGGARRRRARPRPDAVVGSSAAVLVATHDERITLRATQVVRVAAARSSPSVRSAVDRLHRALRIAVARDAPRAKAPDSRSSASSGRTRSAAATFSSR